MTRRITPWDWMKRASTALAVAALFACSSGETTPDRAPATNVAPPAATLPFLADVKTSVVVAASSKREYQISVALPDSYKADHPPYDVLYAVDANVEFGTLVETARALAFEKDIPDLVVVGIGYANPGQGFKASNAPRTRDLTPTSDPAWLAESADEFRELGVPVAESSGGAQAFLNFLEGDLIPQIEQTYNVKREDRAFFGHSFGGLFGLYALFNGHGLFSRFIVGSPSIWWNGKSILAIEKNFAGTSRALPARLFLAVGAREEAADPRYPMVADLTAFTTLLKRRQYAGLVFDTHFFDDDDHLSVVPATISKGLRFLYPTP